MVLVNCCATHTLQHRGACAGLGAEESPTLLIAFWLSPFGFTLFLPSPLDNTVGTGDHGIQCPNSLFMTCKICSVKGTYLQV